MTSPSYVTLHLLVSEINVWPEALCCCFTRTTLFTKILVCLYYSVDGFLSVHKVSSLNSVRFLKSNNNNNNKMKNCENELLQF